MWHLKCGLGFEGIQGPTGENGLWEGIWGGVWLSILKETRVAEEAEGILSMPNPGSRNYGVVAPSWDQCEGKGWRLTTQLPVSQSFRETVPPSKGEV